MAGIEGDSNGDKALAVKRKRRAEKKKIEFLDWGSRPLIEFLEAIGKDVTTKPSLAEVTNLVINYINDNKLPSLEKKKKNIICDERLCDLFGKKTITRNSVYGLLEKHFAENLSTSDDEPMDNSDEENLQGKKIKPIVPMVPQTPKSCFASVVSDNIKLLYLRKGLVQEFLKAPESLNHKVVGSFVRMKTDPEDIFQKHRYQLRLVTGVEMVSEAGSEVRLRVANYFKDVTISMLSDGMFTDEEIEDVRDRIKAGALKRLTVVELESKAQLLHSDIMSHSIAKELDLLKGRIDHANDKGWRRELVDYLDRRKLLLTPSEVDKLLHNVPEVIAEELEPDAAIVASPRSILMGTSNVSSTDASGSGNPAAPSQLVIEDLQTPTAPTGDFLSGDLVKNPQGGEDFNEVLGDHLKSPTITFTEEEKVGSGDTDETSMEIDDEPTDYIQQGTPQQPTAQSEELPQQPADPTVVISLSSDEESEPAKLKTNGTVSGACRDSRIWHYADPLLQGKIHGPFSLTMLEQWHGLNVFGPDFTIWKAGQSPKDAVLLSDVLGTP